MIIDQTARSNSVSDEIQICVHTRTYNCRVLLKPAGFGSPSNSLPFIPRVTWFPKNQDATPSSGSRVSRDNF